MPAASVTRAKTVLAPSAAAKVVDQLVPLVLYSSVAPVSALTVMVPLRVRLSLALLPLSHTKLSVGVAMVVSTTRARVWALLTLPAASLAVMLTLPELTARVGVTLQLPLAATVVLSTSPVPGMVMRMVLPAVPVPLRVGVLSLVSKSAVLPLLLASSSLAVNAIACVLSVKLKGADVATLPAASVARTVTVLAPSAAAKVVAQLVPLVLYSRVAPASALTLMAPLLVMPSVALAPLSHTRLSVGGAMAVSNTRARVWALLTLPAASLAVMLTLPELTARVGVTLQLPLAATVVLSTSPVPGMVMRMVLPAVPVPLRVGVLSLVSKSAVLPLLLASSSLAVKLGACVSMA